MKPVWTHPFGISLWFWKTAHSTPPLSQHLHQLFSSILIWFLGVNRKKGPVIWTIITRKSRFLNPSSSHHFDRRIRLNYRYCKLPSMWSLRSTRLPGGFGMRGTNETIGSITGSSAYGILRISTHARISPNPSPPPPVAFSCLNSRDKNKTRFFAARLDNLHFRKMHSTTPTLV